MESFLGYAVKSLGVEEVDTDLSLGWCKWHSLLQESFATHSTSGRFPLAAIVSIIGYAVVHVLELSLN